MTPEEEWLEKNTFYCPDLKIKLIPSACDENRKRNENAPGWGSVGVNTGRPISACEKCTEHEARKLTVGQKPEEKETMAIATCKCCGREHARIAARGLCNTCYNYFKDGDLELTPDGTFKWLIDEPDYFVELKTGKPVPKIEKKRAKTGTCPCCKREDIGIASMGLCASCYKYFNLGDLEKNNDGTYTWQVDEPKYFREAMLDLVFPPKEEEHVEPCEVYELKDGKAVPIEEDETTSQERLQPTSDLLAGFVMHQNTGKPAESPQITIRKNGAFAFSRSSAKEFSLSSYQHVQIYFNYQTRQVAIELLNKSSDSTVKLFTTNGGKDFLFEGMAFLTANNLKHSESKRYEPTELKPGLLVVTVENIEKVAA
ncbi:hypothetical protein SYK_06830 [Pseudodesulfovibrio nedwellii]|uniref:Uncharacterized protein n=1 Tax=Pseudodesulfovibrio nedwellii TaxID=2973072 RepID=A0ABN6S206_9BACT|nr:hypothetical protein [Pseudodesulfovibrio nedwellii]BDQ35910.1 hypothetical protein SYK_02700 [Pseudodesulfovibrio nedwellii]BDQ36323.1 hypothetical protein SYK_06830 [Pseudodesulfovibrio nedwellii]